MFRAPRTAPKSVYFHLTTLPSCCQIKNPKILFIYHLSHKKQLKSTKSSFSNIYEGSLWESSTLSPYISCSRNTLEFIYAANVQHSEFQTVSTLPNFIPWHKFYCIEKRVGAAAGLISSCIRCCAINYARYGEKKSAKVSSSFFYFLLSESAKVSFAKPSLLSRLSISKGKLLRGIAWNNDN